MNRGLGMPVELRRGKMEQYGWFHVNKSESRFLSNHLWSGKSYPIRLQDDKAANYFQLNGGMLHKVKFLNIYRESNNQIRSVTIKSSCCWGGVKNPKFFRLILPWWDEIEDLATKSETLEMFGAKNACKNCFPGYNPRVDHSKYYILESNGKYRLYLTWDGVRDTFRYIKTGRVYVVKADALEEVTSLVGLSGMK